MTRRYSTSILLQPQTNEYKQHNPSTAGALLLTSRVCWLKFLVPPLSDATVARPTTRTDWRNTHWHDSWDSARRNFAVAGQHEWIVESSWRRHCLTFACRHRESPRNGTNSSRTLLRYSHLHGLCWDPDYSVQLSFRINFLARATCMESAGIRIILFSLVSVWTDTALLQWFTERRQRFL